MKDSPPIAEPVLLVRPRGTHRFEAFSPNLARRVMLYRRSLLQHWLLVEADPSVISCCDRPDYVLIDGHRRFADFFVFYIDCKKLIILIDQMADDSAKTSCRDLDSTAFPIRPVAPAELAAARVWTDNCDPLGFAHEFELERVWLFVIIDVCTRAVLGYPMRWHGCT